MIVSLSIPPAYVIEMASTKVIRFYGQGKPLKIHFSLSSAYPFHSNDSIMQCDCIELPHAFSQFEKNLEHGHGQGYQYIIFKEIQLNANENKKKKTVTVILNCKM